MFECLRHRSGLRRGKVDVAGFELLEPLIGSLVHDVDRRAWSLVAERAKDDRGQFGKDVLEHAEAQPDRLFAELSQVSHRPVDLCGERVPVDLDSDANSPRSGRSWRFSRANR